MIKRRIVVFFLLLCFSAGSLTGATSKSLYKKAEKLYDRGEYDQAIEFYRKAHDVNKKFFKSYRYMIYCFEKKNDMNAISTEIENYLKKNSMIDVDNKAFLFAYQAKAFSYSGKLSQADEKINRAIRIVSNDKDKKEFQGIKKEIKKKKMEFFSSEYKKAESFFKSGNREKSLGILRNLLNIDRSDSRVASLFSKIRKIIANEKKQEEVGKLVKKARDLEAAGKWEEAKFTWDDLLVIGGNDFNKQQDVDAFNKRWSEFKSNKKEKTERAQIQESEKKTKKMLIKKAMSNFKNEEWRAAGEALRKLRKLEPQEQKWQRMYKRVLKNRKLIQSMNHGLRLLEEKDYEQAISVLEEVYNSEKKKSRRISKALAEAYFEKERWSDTINVVTNFLGNKSLSKLNLELYKLLSKAYIQVKKFEDAQVALNDYISLQPNDIGSKYILADLYIDSGKYDKAQKHLKKFSNIQEQADRAFLKYKKLYEKKYEATQKFSDFDDLLKTYKIRIAMYTSDSPFFRQLSYELGKIYYEHSKFPEAYVHLDNALMKMKPVEEKKYHDIRSMYNKCWFMRYMIYFQVIGGILGLVLLKILWVSVIEPIMVSLKEGRKDKLKLSIKKFKNQKKYDKVVVACKEIITKYPLNVSEAKQLRAELAEAYLELGKYDEAEKEGKDLLKLERNYKSAHKVVSMVYFKRGEFPQAIKQCRLVFDFDISEPVIHTIFQNSYKALNNKEELIMEYEDMIQMNPDNINLRNIYLKLQNEFLTDDEKES